MASPAKVYPVTDSIELLTPEEYDREISRATFNLRGYTPHDLGVRVVTALEHFRERDDRIVTRIAYQDGSQRFISCPYPTR